MLTPFFTAQAVEDYASARCSDTARFGVFFRTLLKSSVYWPPAQFECAMLSAAHTEADIDATVAAAAAAFAAIQTGLQ